MTTNFLLHSLLTPSGTLNIELNLSDTTYSYASVYVASDAGSDGGLERFADINAALRSFFFRYRSGNPEKPSRVSNSISETYADIQTVSAPVDGLRAYCKIVEGQGDVSAAYKHATAALRTYDKAFDLTPEELENPTLPSKTLISQHDLGEGRNLVLSIVGHPVPAVRATGEKIIKVSITDEYPTPAEVEYFFDIDLAYRSFASRRNGAENGVTRTGMEYRTGVSHYENRNIGLASPMTSIPKDVASAILKNLIMTRRWEEVDMFYFVLSDTIHAAYGGHLSKWLGSVTVTSSGDGHYAPKRVQPITVSLLVDINPEIERDEAGLISFAHCFFKAYYDDENWHDRELKGRDLPYTDSGTENGINEFLKELGYDGRVGWSEHGRQTVGECDFDMDYSLIHQIFPGRVAADGISNPTETIDHHPTV